MMANIDMRMVANIDMAHAYDLVKVQSMAMPRTLFDFYGFEWFYDLGYGVLLNKDECLKLIKWWENGGKEEYGKE